LDITTNIKKNSKVPYLLYQVINEKAIPIVFKMSGLKESENLEEEL
jgi:hypothetical protein